MNPSLKEFNQRHKSLRKNLYIPDTFEQAKNMLFEQHAFVHQSTVYNGTQSTISDELAGDLSEEIFRRIPKNREHSIAWAIWHIARIEDMTMNILLANREQVFSEEWKSGINSPVTHTGNSMSIEKIRQLSEQIRMNALFEYRIEVGKRTREILSGLVSDDIKQKVHPERIQKLWDLELVLPDAASIVDYWSKRDIGGLLLMPPTRHNLVHLNECEELKNRKN